MESGNVEMELEFIVGKKYGKSYDENANSENCGGFSTKILNFRKEISMQIYYALFGCDVMRLVNQYHAHY